MPLDLKRLEVDLVVLEDGFTYYWVHGKGALSEQNLRDIADELKRRNAAWQQQIEKDLR